MFQERLRLSDKFRPRSAMSDTKNHRPKGPSINDVRKIFSPPWLHLVLIYSIEFTQPTLLHLLFGGPSHSKCGYNMWMVP